MRGKIDKKVMIPLIASGIIASQLMGCASASSKEFLDLLNKGEAIEIEVAVPESIEEGTEKDLEWVQLDQLSTYPEFRRAMDDALFITNFGDNSKNGILYVDLEGNHEGNNTLYNAFMNNAFRENYWENEEVQKQVQEAVLEVYADVEAETEGIKVAALNAYYNLLPDAEPNYFNGESLINRGEFMALLYRSENPVQDLESNEEFTSLVGESDNTDFAYSLVEDSYLSTSDKSLNAKTFNGTMTRGEAIYMLMHHFYGDELSTYTNSPSLPDIKNGGDIASKQKFEGDYSTSVELIYSLQNADAGAPEEIYKAVGLAYDKGILESTEDSRWDEGITKEEALTLLTNTLSSMPTKGSYHQGASSSDSETSTEASDITALDLVLYAIEEVPVKADYSEDAETIRTLAKYEEVTVTGITTDGEWYEISEDGKKVYVDAEALVDGNELNVLLEAETEEEVPETNETESVEDNETESTVQETESEVASEAPSQTQTESQAPAETVPTPAPQETVPVDSLTEAQQKVVDQINQGQQQTGGTPVDNGGSAEADALLGGPPTAATSSWLNQPAGDLDISGSQGAGGILHAAD